MSQSVQLPGITPATIKQHCLVYNENPRNPRLELSPINDTNNLSDSTIPNLQKAAGHFISYTPIIQAGSPPTTTSPRSNGLHYGAFNKLNKKTGKMVENEGNSSDGERREQANMNASDRVHREKVKLKDNQVESFGIKISYSNDLSPEELERVKFLRSLRALESGWEATRQYRMEYEKVRRDREWALIKSLDTVTQDSAKMNTEKVFEIEDANDATQNYLHRAILRRLSEHHNQETRELLVSEIMQFEQQIIHETFFKRWLTSAREVWQCPLIRDDLKIHMIEESFRLSKDTRGPLDLSGYWIRNLDKIGKLQERYSLPKGSAKFSKQEACAFDLAKHFESMQNIKNSPYTNCLPEETTCILHLAEHYELFHGIHNPLPKTPAEVRERVLELADHFKLSRQVKCVPLSEDDFRDVMQGSHPRDFTKEQARYLIYLCEDPRLYAGEVFAEEGQLAAGSSVFKSGDLKKELQKSSLQSGPTDKYIEIMEEIMGDSFARYRQVAIPTSVRFVKAAHLDDDNNDDAFRTIIKGDIKQEFLQDGNGGISAVLFKHQRPFSVATVVQTDLDAMGWSKKDSHGLSETTNTYWRFQRGISPETKDFVFRISMDGEVLGVWTPMGDIGRDENMLQYGSADASDTATRLSNMEL